MHCRFFNCRPADSYYFLLPTPGDCITQFHVAVGSIAMVTLPNKICWLNSPLHARILMGSLARMFKYLTKWNIDAQNTRIKVQIGDQNMVFLLIFQGRLAMFAEENLTKTWRKCHEKSKDNERGRYKNSRQGSFFFYKSTIFISRQPNCHHWKELLITLHLKRRWHLVGFVRRKIWMSDVAKFHVR